MGTRTGRMTSPRKNEERKKLGMLYFQRKAKLFLSVHADDTKMVVAEEAWLLSGQNCRIQHHSSIKCVCDALKEQPQSTKKRSGQKPNCFKKIAKSNVVETLQTTTRHNTHKFGSWSSGIKRPRVTICVWNDIANWQRDLCLAKQAETPCIHDHQLKNMFFK